MSFIRVEIVPFANRTDRVGNKAHENYLNWSLKYPHINRFRVKLSHEKTHIDFMDEDSFEKWKETWPHYWRRIY